MTASEKNYLMKRVDEIAAKKQTEIREKKQNNPSVFNLKYALVKAGKVKLCKNVNRANDHAFSEYDFSKHPECTAYPYWQVPAELSEEVTRIKDEIMLGTTDKAHKLLKSFENWKMK